MLARRRIPVPTRTITCCDAENISKITKPVSKPHSARDVKCSMKGPLGFRDGTLTSSPLSLPASPIVLTALDSHHRALAYPANFAKVTPTALG